MVIFGDKARLRLEPQSPLNLGHFCPNLGKEHHGDVKSPNDPSSDTTFEGRVYLTILGVSPRSVPSLSINLTCRQNVYIRGRFLAYELYNHTVHLDTSAQVQGGTKWMPGEHAFSFSFAIPADSAPTEDCHYGRTIWVLSAKAGELGALGGDLNTDRQITFTTNPSPLGTTPAGFGLQRQLEHEVLGPVGIYMASPLLLVAGWLHLKVTIPSFSQKTQLEVVRVSLIQDLRLQNMMEPESDTVIKTITLPLWSTKRSQGLIGTFETGQSYDLSEAFRLPEDGKLLRPSTSQNSKTGIRVEHLFQIDIHFRTSPSADTPEPSPLVITVASAATISACCNLIEELQLPAYSAKANDHAIDKKNLASFCTKCLCMVANSPNAEEYGIPAADLEQALKIEQQGLHAKADVEYEREVRERCRDEEGGAAASPMQSG